MVSESQGKLNRRFQTNDSISECGTVTTSELPGPASENAKCSNGTCASVLLTAVIFGSIPPQSEEPFLECSWNLIPSPIADWLAASPGGMHPMLRKLRAQ